MFLFPAIRSSRLCPSLVQGLSSDRASDFAQAILTTDQGPKMSHARVRLGSGRTATVMAIAKGAGMIHPNMATTLGFVMTDAVVSRAHLHRLLKRSADRTFNRISVDGDTSTNDTLLALASGALGGAPVPVRGALSDRFERALTGVLEDVAKMIVADGEGAQHLVKIEVVGAESEKAATAVARTIATSQLVKTAIHGCDPNWGRILGAAGRAGVAVDSSIMTVHVGGVCVYRRGRPLSVEKEASAAMKQTEYTVRVRLGSGELPPIIGLVIWVTNTCASTRNTVPSFNRKVAGEMVASLHLGVTRSFLSMATLCVLLCFSPALATASSIPCQVDGSLEEAAIEVLASERPVGAAELVDIVRRAGSGVPSVRGLRLMADDRVLISEWVRQTAEELEAPVVCGVARDGDGVLVLAGARLGSLRIDTRPELRVQVSLDEQVHSPHLVIRDGGGEMIRLGLSEDEIESGLPCRTDCVLR